MSDIIGTNEEIIESIHTFLIKKGKQVMKFYDQENTHKGLKYFHEKYKLNFEELKERLNDDNLYQIYVMKINEELSF